MHVDHDDFDVRIDRTGPWGNPFVQGVDGDRELVLRKFAALLAQRMARSGNLDALRIVMKGKRLGCHCRPVGGFGGRLLCHGQLYAGLLDGIEPKDAGE